MSIPRHTEEALVDARSASILLKMLQAFPNLSVAVKELKLSYHNSDIILFTIYAYYGNLN